MCQRRMPVTRSPCLPVSSLFAEGCGPAQSSSRAGSRSTATGLPSPRHSLQLVEEGVEVSLADLGEAVLAAGWSQMVRRRVLDPEQVVEQCPDVALRVPRLALADVKDHNAGGALGFVGRLNGEGEPKAALEMESANDRSERTGESVCTELLRARVPTELVMSGSIPSPLSHELVYELAHRARGYNLELGHLQRRSSVVRTERVRRRSGNQPPLGERTQPRAVELLELALVDSVVALKLVDKRNDEVALTTAPSEIGNSLGEVERGVPRNSGPTARRPLHRDDALLDPFVECRNADTNDLRRLALAHRVVQITAEILDDRLELVLHVPTAACGPPEREDALSSSGGVDRPCDMHKVADLCDIFVISASLRMAERVLTPLG
jgi:hypothetical protein